MRLVFRDSKQAAKPRRLAKAVSGRTAALNRLRAFLANEEPRTMRWLTSMWRGQQNAVTYAELRELMLQGGGSEALLERWQNDYANMINTHLAPQWQRAMAHAIAEQQRQFPSMAIPSGIRAAQDYVLARGAEFVTAMTDTQRAALRNMVAHAAGFDGMTAENLAVMMRPVIGLNERQVMANLRYWNAMWESGVRAGLSPQAAVRRANRMAANYAARQHRYRARMIARTELATAYNQGAYNATKQAQEQGLLGDCKKTWVTAGDHRVCPHCKGLDGETVNMDAMFSNGQILPPAHPQCRCAVIYEEVAPPIRKSANYVPHEGVVMVVFAPGLFAIPKK